MIEKANSQNWLGVAYLHEKKYVESEEMLKMSLQLFYELLGMNN